MTPEPLPRRSIITPPVPPRRLSHDLEDLRTYAAGRALSIGEIEIALKARGFALLILVFALPFSLPVSIPGLSIPFGLVITFMGCRLALGLKPWLPQFIRRREIKANILERTLAFGIRLSQRMEKLARPRLHFLQRFPGMINLIGLGIASGGLLLSAPFPPFIPLTNTLPALGILCLTAGMIERDGVLVLTGYAMSLLAWAYFVTCFLLGEAGLRRLWDFVF